MIDLSDQALDPINHPQVADGKKTNQNPHLQGIIIAILTVGIGVTSYLASNTNKSTDVRSKAVETTANQTAPTKPVFAFYYLWWSETHWHDKLGANYPYTQSPLLLPATLDPDGCNPVSLYAGNQLIDVHDPLWIQDNPGVIEQDVRDAASAGIAGFIANWSGDGVETQTKTSNSYNERLEALIQAVNKVNGEGLPFKLWISYKASATILTLSQIQGDLRYLKNTYANDSSFDKRYSSRIMLIWQGSKKYDFNTIQTVSNEFRDTFFVLGDEKWDTWDLDGRPQYLDGDTYYWSTQNPYTNPNSFTQLQDLANKVRSSGTNPDGSAKLWFAPFTPGYNSILLGGSTCIPRNKVTTGDTMHGLFDGNSPSNPDGWTFISWNEIAEGSYILPMRRWGRTYLDVLASITGGQQASPPPVASPTPVTNPSSNPLPLPSGDTTGPIVTITNPVSGIFVNKNSTVTITANATDNIGVGRVEFRVNGTLKCTDTSFSYSCNWRVSGKAGTSYTIEAKAFDAAGNSSSSTITVTSQ